MIAFLLFLLAGIVCGWQVMTGNLAVSLRFSHVAAVFAVISALMVRRENLKERNIFQAKGVPYEPVQDKKEISL